MNIAEQIIEKFDREIYEADECFVNNLIGLLHVELTLSKAEGRELDLKTSLDFIGKHRPLQLTQSLTDEQRAPLIKIIDQVTEWLDNGEFNDDQYDWLLNVRGNLNTLLTEND